MKQFRIWKLGVVLLLLLIIVPPIFKNDFWDV